MPRRTLPRTNTALLTRFGRVVESGRCWTWRSLANAPIARRSSDVTPRNRYNVAVGAGLGVILAITAVWIGEAESGLPSVLEIAVPVVGACTVAIVTAHTRARRALVGVLTFVTLITSILLGRHEGAMAFNDCVANAESVRPLLRDYKRRHGEFPGSLSKLGAALPCQRLLRGTLLAYEPSGDGYDLYFGDWLVTHSASDSHGFGARK